MASRVITHKGKDYIKTNSGWVDKGTGVPVSPELEDILEDNYVSEDIKEGKNNVKTKITCPKCNNGFEVTITELEQPETICPKCNNKFTPHFAQGT